MVGAELLYELRCKGQGGVSQVMYMGKGFLVQGTERSVAEPESSGEGIE